MQRASKLDLSQNMGGSPRVRSEFEHPKNREKKNPPPPKTQSTIMMFYNNQHQPPRLICFLWYFLLNHRPLGTTHQDCLDVVEGFLAAAPTTTARSTGANQNVHTPNRLRTTAAAANANNNANATNTRKDIPAIRTADLCGIWTIELRTTTTRTNSSNTRSEEDTEDTTSSSSSSSSSSVVVRLNEDGTFAYSPSSASSLSCILSEQQYPSSSNNTNRNTNSHSHSTVLDLHTIMRNGGVWNYRNDEGNHGELILAMNRDQQQQHRNTAAAAVVDTILTGKLSVTVSVCLEDDVMSIRSNNTNPNTIDPTAVRDNDGIDGGAVRSSNNSTTTTSQDTEQQFMDLHLSVPNGTVVRGTFMYPKQHPNFFEDPILVGIPPPAFAAASSSSLGTDTDADTSSPTTMNSTFVHMQQLLGKLNTVIQSTKKKKTKRWTTQDFYHRTFYLTATPHPVNLAYAKADTHYDEAKAVLNVVTLPITFYANNTFAAIGTERILRGRYGLSSSSASSSSASTALSRDTEEEDDRREQSLWFQVSLFGAGRCVSGSVYSEGRLLSAEDRRGYIGSILQYEQTTENIDDTKKKKKNDPTTTINTNANTMLFYVEGEYYYGADLQNPVKTRSMGTFSLQEITPKNTNNNNDDSATADDEDDEDDEDEDTDDEDANTSSNSYYESSIWKKTSNRTDDANDADEEEDAFQ